MMPQTSQEHHQSGLPIASRAPTARPIPAWGVAPGTGTDNAQGLKARPIHISIPQIPFVEFHSVFLEKCTELILKRLLSVMHLLTIDVFDQRTQVRRPNRESAIPSLPCELRQFRRLGLKPLGRGRFELFDYLRDILCARQANCKMNVVRDPARRESIRIRRCGQQWQGTRRAQGEWKD